MTQFYSWIIRMLCNFHVFFIIGMTLALQTLYMESGRSQQKTGSDFNTEIPTEVGDMIHYGSQDPIEVRYSTYAKRIMHRLILQPNYSDIARCDGSSFELSDVAGLPVREAGLYQTLGDSNIHILRAYLDDRLPNRKFLRVLAVGLYPGPKEKLFCNYDCSTRVTKFCSSPLAGVILLSGNWTDPENGKYTGNLLFHCRNVKYGTSSSRY